MKTYILLQNIMVLPFLTHTGGVSNSPDSRQLRNVLVALLSLSWLSLYPGMHVTFNCCKYSFCVSFVCTMLLSGLIPSVHTEKDRLIVHFKRFFIFYKTTTQKMVQYYILNAIIFFHKLS